MGYRIRRVALDFAWPLEEVWKGYLNPHSDKAKTCPTCQGFCADPATVALYRKLLSEGVCLDQQEVDLLVRKGFFYGVSPALDRQRQEDRKAASVRYFLAKKYERLAQHAGSRSKREAFLAKARDYRSWESRQPSRHLDAVKIPARVGSDAAWAVAKRRAKRLGIYSHCRDCLGSGFAWESREAKKLFKKWREFEPPAGPGWQLWETVSEGSPVSPVFPTRDEFEIWLRNVLGYSTRAVRAFIEREWAPSFAGHVDESGVQLEDGVEGLARVSS